MPLQSIPPYLGVWVEAHSELLGIILAASLLDLYCRPATECRVSGKTPLADPQMWVGAFLTDLQKTQMGEKKVFLAKLLWRRRAA